MSIPAFLPSSIRTALAERAVDDRSTALALAAVVAAADAEGRAPLHDVAVAFRDAWLHAMRLDGADDERERGRLSLDEIRGHLSTSDLPRLEATAVLVPSGDPDLVRVSPVLWPLVSADRDAMREAWLNPTMSASVPTPAHAVPVIAEGSALASGAAEAPVQRTGSVLTATGLVKVYRRRRVVNGVDITVRQGEIVGLLGPNGAGKTTSFYQIVGLIAPDEGTVQLDGEDITQMPMYQRARRGIGYLSQEPSIFRKLTVEENILAILETLPLKPAERAARLDALLDDLKIRHLRKSKAFALSGGERRRLEITRALVTDPKFMMLDEPFAGVDPIAVHDIQQIVANLRHRGIGVVISDHNVEQTLDIVDRAYIMFDGQVKVSGTVKELVFDDTVARIYLGPTLTARLRQRFAEREQTEVVA
ncbi:MAG: LPS export ABC transporter ATP-binding protein [Gemmatimonadaceae bacterium]|nr:LPS export ABC transporter ATP-binding protein [Gemmatimonadaceae bacterium]